MIRPKKVHLFFKRRFNGRPVVISIDNKKVFKNAEVSVVTGDFKIEEREPLSMTFNSVAS